MAFIQKARDLPGSPMTGATIRLASRESFDTRAAVQVPSATGGAPPMKAPEVPKLNLAAPGRAALPGAVPGAMPMPDPYLQVQRPARTDQPILPFLLSSRHSIADYNSLAPGFAEQLATDFQSAGAATGGMDAMELAQRTVAAIQRYADPTATSTDLPTAMYQNQNARKVMKMLDQIRSRRAAR